MLLPHEVLPFLTADDPIARNHATHYFAHAHDVGPLTADHVWAAIDKTGLTRSAGALLRLLEGVPQSDTSTGRLLAALDAVPADAAPRDLLLDALDDVAFDQLRRHADRILARTDLPPESRTHLAERLRLADVPLDALWDDFLRLAAPPPNTYLSDIDQGAKDRLTEALARHGDAAAALAMNLVNLDVIADDYTESFAIDLLARLRHRPALDRLVKRFVDADDEDDVAHEDLQSALPRVGGADAVEPIARHFLDRSWTYRLYAGEALARIKHPGAEAALLRLLDDPKAADARDNVAHALLSLCSTQALPRLREIVIVDGDYDPMFADLEGDFVAVALMTNFDFPEFAARREEVLAREIEDQRRRDAGDFDHTFDDFFGKLKGARHNLDDVDDLEDDVSYPALPENLDDRGPALTAPIRNAQPKVGRNDPCPCGSGKKYKKCCLDQA